MSPESKAGSSPCVWGQENPLRLKPAVARIIPMRVGTSKIRGIKIHDVEDHPHACGDKFCHLRLLCRRSGSSPCVWGQADPNVCAVNLTGIIPMRVGTRFQARLLSKRLEDHPHACGDKVPCRQCQVPSQGSSPCVWGQETTITHSTGVERIIPMRVGTRILPLVYDDSLRDHPHACGDKCFSSAMKIAARGSSPCVWGQVSLLLLLLALDGIIPMRVGTSDLLRLVLVISEDHPHACGDKRSERQVLNRV